MAKVSLDSLPTELINLIIDHVPRDEYKIAVKNRYGEIVAGEYISKNTRNYTLRALCLCSRRMGAICTPHLYRRFENKTPEYDEKGLGLSGKRLLLLLRTIIRNPDRGRLLKHVVASTWQSLDTEDLTDEDMKAALEQAGMITSNYPLRVTTGFLTGKIYLGPPPHPETEGKNAKKTPKVGWGQKIMSNGQRAPFADFSSTEVKEFGSHPQYDFPFCSALSWCHAIRVGEWDAIFTLLLSYLPNMETLTIHNPDAGERCPFGQCIYLTSFMERVAISQQLTEIPGEMKRLQVKGRRLLPGSHEAAITNNQQEPLGWLERKRPQHDYALALPSVKRQKIQVAASMSRLLPGTQRLVAKRQWLAKCSDKYSKQAAEDIDSQQWQPLLQRFRSITLDCIYRSSDVLLSDVMPFLRPQSVEDFYCGYLYGSSWPGDTKLRLKSLMIKHGHMNAKTFESFIRCCAQLTHLSFESAGDCQMAYQSLASPLVMAALETVAGTLEHLNLMKVDMNYWHPALDVTQLQGYTGYTFKSFASFTKLKRLYLKAESLIRHSKSDPEADSGPLWAKLPPSIEHLQLAGNKKWFENLIPQLQELASMRDGSDGVLPNLQQVVLEFRDVEVNVAPVHHDGDIVDRHSGRPQHNTTVISFAQRDTTGIQKAMSELLEDVLLAEAQQSQPFV